MRLAVAVLCSLPLAACTIAQSDATADREPIDQCRGDTLGQFAGQPAGQQVGARMLAASGARVIRWVPKGAMVTMDYRGDRITVFLDESNRVERASCG
ncbi:MAG TPA: I78 family peptidase inhibitor [Sphingomicrobium sp.]|nr:I78 family peptidase inhibitor [Sphingomicrobium sp.]